MAAKHMGMVLSDGVSKNPLLIPRWNKRTANNYTHKTPAGNKGLCRSNSLSI